MSTERQPAFAANPRRGGGRVAEQGRERYSTALGPVPKGEVEPQPSGGPSTSLAGLRRTLSAGFLTRFAYASGSRLRMKSKPAYACMCGYSNNDV